MVEQPDENDISPDRAERVEDFLARHGGRGNLQGKDREASEGDTGWFEIYAADGYRLRCEWSKFDSREEMTFMEIPPQTKV